MDRREARATVAARLRTLLEPEVGVSPDLAQALVAVLDAGLHPAVPVTGYGAAGEIIPLAHLGGFLTGYGEGVDGRASDLLTGAGLASYTFRAKEGVAFLQGVPASAAQAALLAADAHVLAGQQLAVAAAEIARVRAPRDPYDAALTRGDAELDLVHACLRALAGAEDRPRMLQAPVSFRVVGPGLAHLLRTLTQLDRAVERALGGVTTSPALVDGRFLGTAGFDGFDLAACADAVRLGMLHVAEVGTARLHRMLDPHVTGLPPQLSAEPGRQAGLVALHKRAAGLVHEGRRTSAPVSLGAMETSLGQEDVQGFTLDAVRAARGALVVLRDVTACELVAVHQAGLLDRTSSGSETLRMVLRQAFADLPDHPGDRPTGRDVAVLAEVLRLGWSQHVLDERGEERFHTPADRA
jgi:histidine ammonia-lyase